MSPENRKVIGEIKTYFLSIEKLKKGLRHVYMKSYEIWTTIFMLLLVGGLAFLYMYEEKAWKLDMKFYILGSLGVVVLYLAFSVLVFFLKINLRSKKIMRTIPKRLLNMPVNIKLYLNKVEFISEEGTGELKYEDFYKIIKLDDGFMFLSQKAVFHYFEFSEIETLYNIDYLDSVLVKYYNK